MFIVIASKDKHRKCFIGI